MTTELDDRTRALVDGRNAATLATINADGRPQTSVIFVGLDQGTLVFSTIKGRLKTRNMTRDPRVGVLVLKDGNFGEYAEIRGTVELVEDPEKVLLRQMYEKYLGTGVVPPPEPEAERLICRVRPDKVFHFSAHPAE